MKIEKYKKAKNKNKIVNVKTHHVKTEVKKNYKIYSQRNKKNETSK